MAENFVNLTHYINFTDGIFWYNNFTYFYLHDEKESMPIIVIKITAYCILFLVSLIGNLSVILAVSRDSRLKSTTNILVANMAVSDTVITLLEIPKNIVDVIYKNKGWLISGQFGEALCKLLPFTADTSFAISLYSCIFIAIDRYYAVAKPLAGGFSKKRLKYIIPGIWIFAAFICLPFLYSYYLVEKIESNSCVEHWSDDVAGKMLKVHFVTFITLTTFLPILGITILYLLIVYKIRKHKVPGVCLESERVRRDRQNKKVFKMSVLIIILLSICWLFFDVLNILETFTSELDNLPYTVRKALLFVATFVLLTSSTHQFLIFLIFIDIYRQNFKMMLSKCFGTCRRSIRVHPQNNSNSTNTSL